MKEKSIEELEAELTILKKENLERQVAAEQAKLADAKKAEDAKEHDLLYTKIENEVMEKLGQKSQIVPDEKAATLQSGGQPKFKVFLNKWVENHGMKGRTYKELMEDMANKGGY